MWVFLGEKKREKKNWAPATKRCAHVVHAWCMHMDMLIGAHMPSTKCTHEHPGSTL